jgi:hypothetical protein
MDIGHFLFPVDPVVLYGSIKFPSLQLQYTIFNVYSMQCKNGYGGQAGMSL